MAIQEKMATLKFWLGIALGVATLVGLLLNILVVRPVYRLAFRDKRSPIYVISFVNIVNDGINLSLALFFLVPTIIADSWFFDEKEHSIVAQAFGVMFMFCWYAGSLTQVLMAVNRLVVICFRSTTFFTRRNIVRLVIAFIPVLIFMAWLAQFGFPCCQFTFNHELLSYSYMQVENVTNYSNKFLDLWLNSSTSIVATVCYLIIIINVHSSSKIVTSTLSSAERRNRRMKEYSYAMQFCLISMFYTCAWVMFRVFPLIVTYVGIEWFVGTAFFVTLNSSANACVYLATNKEVTRYLTNKWPGYAVRSTAGRATADRSQGQSNSDQQISVIQPTNAQSTATQAPEIKNN